MLKILIAEDDMISRKLLWKVLAEYGECDLVVNGIEAIDAYMIALKEKEPYDLICLDIMMPKVDGIKVLKTIRDIEIQFNVEKEAKIIMATALSEREVVDDSFEKGANAYAAKPIDIDKLLEVMKNLELI
ncbi:MAG: response regulator [Anaeromicrobium sp.]|uniref:response regulator n=1 Tax=Anaeromicrobium sp. TaxID=1929132 RepID=UPI0025FA43D4|nr:response regulator [Anaeromicrobium sp.]MCT4593668.1 response regulator [Anaeromicrobium sp.]